MQGLEKIGPKNESMNYENILNNPNIPRYSVSGMMILSSSLFPSPSELNDSFPYRINFSYEKEKTLASI